MQGHEGRRSSLALVGGPWRNKGETQRVLKENPGKTHGITHGKPRVRVAPSLFGPCVYQPTCIGLITATHPAPGAGPSMSDSDPLEHPRVTLPKNVSESLKRLEDAELEMLLREAIAEAKRRGVMKPLNTVAAPQIVHVSPLTIGREPGPGPAGEVKKVSGVRYDWLVDPPKLPAFGPDPGADIAIRVPQWQISPRLGPKLTNAISKRSGSSCPLSAPFVRRNSDALLESTTEGSL
jgi:hypothetical protein